jgi:hypothetical protein
MFLKLGGLVYYYIVHSTTIIIAFNFYLKAEYYSFASATAITTNKADSQT